MKPSMVGTWNTRFESVFLITLPRNSNYFKLSNCSNNFDLDLTKTW